MTSDGHAGHPRFLELLDQMRSLHGAKSADYSGPRDPLRNLRRCADAGVPPWKGVIVRLSDKYDRLLTFAEKETYQVKTESVVDTFLDMAVYALLGVILYEETLGPGLVNEAPEPPNPLRPTQVDWPRS